MSIASRIAAHAASRIVAPKATPMATPMVSLRSRLICIIMLPLLFISAFVGWWRFDLAKDTSEKIFDRNLLAITLAVSRDVMMSRGDALSLSTRDLLKDTSAGQIFYHVRGPDGAFVTGYSYPPIPPKEVSLVRDKPVFYDSAHNSKLVRVVKLTEAVEIDQIVGLSTVTVWQQRADRDAFARQQARRTIFLIGAMILSVMAVVWFGVSIGLRPLISLQEAISLRSSGDLRQIRRSIPLEVSGIVKTLNRLFQQVTDAMSSRDAFISDAAHQLRNPVAGLLSMAEATKTAKTEKDRKQRAAELVIAARHTKRLTQQLLAYERARGQIDHSNFTTLDVNRVIEAVAFRNGDRIMERAIALEFFASNEPAIAEGDATMLAEVFENIIDNMLIHAGGENDLLRITVTTAKKTITITIRDNGVGIPAQLTDKVFARFASLGMGGGSGLGLSIVKEILRQHGGKVDLPQVAKGACFRIILPLVREITV